MINLEKYDIIDIFADIFNSLGIRAYIVGGAVRDMLLNVEPLDFDFAAELDGDEHLRVSREIAEKLKCSYKYNEFYHTAKLCFKGLDIDFVMARAESYASIASRPRVWPSSITDDLKRRDFTINALAACLSIEEYGKVIDPFKGQEDIGSKLLRAFHKDSFSDDPTRIFRGIKYAGRFGFGFEKETKKWITDSINCGVLKYLKPERIKQELQGVLREKEIHKVLGFMEEFNLIGNAADFSVNINKSFNSSQFKRLNINQKLTVLFYKNEYNALIKIKRVLNLPEEFIEGCEKIAGFERILLLQDDEVYKHMIRERNSLNSRILQTLFYNDERIINFTKNKEKLKLSKRELQAAEGNAARDSFVQKKIENLNNYLRSEN